MSAQIIPYVFDDDLVRVVMRDGAPWFVGKDVCRVLNLVNHKDALGRLDDDEKGVATADPLSRSERGGGAQEMTIISEPGVYRLVFTSRKSEAERFKRWLAHEVIPSIRQTGQYRAEPEPEPLAAPRPLGTAMPAAPEPMVGGEPMSLMRLRLDIVREARMNLGVAHARKLWHEFGLPCSAGRGGEPDEGRLLLLRLLQARLAIGDTRWSVEDALHAALNGDDAVRKALFECGLRVDEAHLWVANASPFLAEIMVGREDWRKHLQAIPGAHATGPKRIGPGRRIANGTSIPMAECSTHLLD
jgi:prophage antirepressor-like protein